MKDTRRTQNLITVDSDTGEKIDGITVLVPKKRNPYSKGWIMSSQEALQELAKDRELTGETLRVFLLLCGTLDFENWIQISQTEIAKELTLKKPNVSRAMKMLETKGIVLKVKMQGAGQAYRLNPDYGWKGKTINLEEERQTRRSEESKQISENNKTKRLELVKHIANQDPEQVET